MFSGRKVGRHAAAPLRAPGRRQVVGSRASTVQVQAKRVAVLGAGAHRYVVRVVVTKA